MNSNWEDILQNKKQCVSWSDENIPSEVIDEILDEVYAHTNSKQNKMPYTMYLLDNSKLEIRKTVFKACLDLDAKGNVRRANTQVLAPWVIIFTPRDVDIHDSKEATHYDYLTRIAAMEVGLTSMLLALSASARGLSVGFCACFNNKYRHDLQQALGTDHSLLLVMGIGKYQEKEFQKSFFDNSEYKTYVSTCSKFGAPQHPRPPREDIIVKL